MLNRQSLILEHLPLAKGIAFRTCRISSLLEDCQSIAIEAMISAIDSYDLDKKASLKTWVIRSVKFAVIDFIKNEIRQSAFNIDDFVDSKELSSNGVEKQIESRDLVFKVVNHINECKQGRKCGNESKALIAYYFDGQLMREIAEWRGCTVPAVSMMISELREIAIDTFGRET